MNDTNVADLLSGIVGLITAIPDSLEDKCGDPVEACLMQMLEDLANELGVNNLVRWDVRPETTDIILIKAQQVQRVKSAIATLSVLVEELPK